MTEVVSGLLFLAVVGAGALSGARHRRAVAEAGSRRQFRVTFPRGATAEQVRAFMRSLSGLLPPRWRRVLGAPVVVFEVRAERGRITHHLIVPVASRDYVLGQLRAALPGVRTEAVEATPTRARLALELRTSSATQALRTDEPEQTAAALLATLQPLAAGEQAVVQWVVRPAPPVPVPEVLTLRDPRPGWAMLLAGRRPEPVRLPAELVRGERDKRREPPFLAVVRLGVQTASPARDRQLLRRILGAFHLATAPGAGFRRRAVPSGLAVARIVRGAVPVVQWPCVLNARELAAFAGLPMGEPRLAGLTLGPSPQLAPAAGIPSRGRVLGRATFPGAERSVAISTADSLRHLHVIGPTGVGKSTLLLNLICGDLSAGHGVVAIDPKGDLITDLLDRMPPRRVSDVIVLDPTDSARPVGFNLLAGSDHAPELVADQVVALFRHLYAAFWGPRTDDILRAALLTLTRQPGMTLAEVPLLLTDEAFRRRLVGRVDDYVLEGFWGWYEALSPGERAQAIGPVLNKLRVFLLRRRLRSVIGQSESTFSLPAVLAERKVLLVSLAKGVLGEDAARLLGSAILAQLWQAVQGRAALPPAERGAVFCFVDEFHDYVGLPTSFADLLAQARGYGFGLTLAHQHLGQLSADLRQAVLANARSRVVFQTAYTDAALLAKEFGPDVSADDLGALGPYEAVAQIAADARVSGPVSLATQPAPPPTDTADRVRQLSRERYGRPADEVERQLRRRTARRAQPTTHRRRRP
ncbi:MAG: hypothetical protein QOJ97_1961 [Solirubrobacteraceae bacterium]|jgi:hypothetical protein|nr:hypothetical protein [Solirubrobacteraceae bacterium]